MVAWRKCSSRTSGWQYVRKSDLVALHKQKSITHTTSTARMLRSVAEIELIHYILCGYRHPPYRWSTNPKEGEILRPGFFWTVLINMQALK